VSAIAVANLLAKVPKHAQAEVKQAFWQNFDDIAAEPGEAAVAEAADGRPRSPSAAATATPRRWRA